MLILRYSTISNVHLHHQLRNCSLIFHSSKCACTHKKSFKHKRRNVLNFPIFLYFVCICRIMMTIGCPMSFHQYPMDLQECNLKMQSCNVYLGKYSNAWNNSIIFYFHYSWIRHFLLQLFMAEGPTLEY